MNLTFCFTSTILFFFTRLLADEGILIARCIKRASAQVRLFFLLGGVLYSSDSSEDDKVYSSELDLDSSLFSLSSGVEYGLVGRRFFIPFFSTGACFDWWV